tara:strand:+ start:95 stop:1273 length:1179 start_codon:yes stop_codon:yes gene_type:complete
MAREELRKTAEAIIADLRGGGSSGISGAQIAQSGRGNLLSFFKLHKGEHERTSAQLDGILNILKKNNQLEKKEADADAKERQREKRQKREKLLESLKGGVNTAASAGKRIVDTLVSPFSNIWQAITKFLKTVLIGGLFNQALFWFSKEENQKKMERVGRFLKFWWPSLLAGYALFFTPIGSLVSGVAAILSAGLPLLAGLILKFPLLSSLVGVGILGTAWWQNKTKNNSLSDSQQDDTPVQEFSTGGFVSGPAGRDRVPAKLTAGEFVMSKGAVQNYGVGTLANMNAAGGGTNRGGPNYFGGGLVESSSMKGDMNFAPSATPVKASTSQKTVPVGTPTRISNTTTTTLPPINYQKPTHRGTKGTQTIPTFTVTSDSSYRSATMMALGIEAML